MLPLSSGFTRLSTCMASTTLKVARCTGRRPFICKRAPLGMPSIRRGFCAAPVEGTTARPTPTQLRWLFVHAGLPMVVFGIVDQSVLIYMGDVIDNSIGVRFALPTLAAAAMGQVFSDTSGVLLGGTIESIALKLGLPLPGLSMAQQRMTITKLVSTTGAVLGVISGCLIGMMNLFVLDLAAAERARRKEQLEKTMHIIMEHARQVVHCERVTLWMVDKEQGEFWTAHLTDSALKQIRIPLDVGMVGQTYQTKRLLNIKDVSVCEAFNRGRANVQKGFIGVSSGFVTRNMLCAPVFCDEEVVAIVQLLNNLDEDGRPIIFEKGDERVINMLARHAAIFIEEANC